MSTQRDGGQVRLPSTDAWPYRARIEDSICRALTEPASPLADAAMRIARAGGKFFRARLVFAAAESVAPDSVVEANVDRLAMAAAAIELLHVGSLVHDDIIDDAFERRGAVTVNAREGLTWAVLAGDMILARASKLSALLGPDEAVLFSELLDALCVGQAMETTSLRDSGRTEAHYLASVAGKTAALIAGACRIGGMQAGASPKQLDALASFGHHFGIAFQILDDLADVVSTEERLGKPTMQDVRGGVVALPVILAQEADPHLVEIVESAFDDDAVLMDLRGMLMKSDGLPAARTMALDYIARARATLLAADLPWRSTTLLDCLDAYVGAFADEVSTCMAATPVPSH